MLSVETKYIVSKNATKETIWLQTLPQGLDLPQTKVTIIYANNQRFIALAYNSILHFRAKYIDIWYYFIWEYIEHGKVSLDYILTKKMIADIFIKVLPYKSFENFQMNLSIFYVLPDNSLRESIEVMMLSYINLSLLCYFIFLYFHLLLVISLKLHLSSYSILLVYNYSYVIH